MRRRAASERGAVIVEAALTIPIFLALLGGAIDLGRIYGSYQTITNAAREGARYSSAPTSPGSLPTSSQVISLVKTQLSSAGVDVSKANISVNQADTVAADLTTGTLAASYSTVTISVPVEYVFVRSSSTTVTVTAKMRNENN